MRVGPTAFSICPAILDTKFIAFVRNPCPLVALSTFNFFDSNLGLDNCNPTCLAINSGPFGKSVKNLPIRRVSTTDALTAPTIPPLTNPSSNLVKRSLLNPLSTVLISVLIYG